MGKIKVTIEKGADLFGAWAENIPGIYGEGNTVQETKDNILAAVELYKKYNDEIPAELQGDMDIEWFFDVQSFLQYYSGIFTKAALERITGINQKQLGHYASGLKKPRRAQVEKIENALRGFIKDMSMIHLL
ncbi:helix-turn-helix transcriptional regulator [Bacteroides sp. f07]|uniref:type II toxin-antitoxin system HicB family antitoxin n=1 Tax=Bacteroides sp. f07 TaxID=3132704 RepID=UPI0034BF9272